VIAISDAITSISIAFGYPPVNSSACYVQGKANTTATSNLNLLLMLPVNGTNANIHRILISILWQSQLVFH